MSRKLIAGIIFGFLWGSIAYAYAVAINTQGLFTSSYSFIFFQWTVLLPYTLLLNTPGINMLALGISALYALLSTAIYAAALILFLQYVFKRIFIIFHFKKQIFYFVIGLSFVAIALVVTFLDHYQKEIAMNEINKTLTSTNLSDPLLAQKIINEDCTISDCKIISYKLYNTPNSFVTIANNINSTIKEHGWNCNNQSNYLTVDHPGYGEIPCDNGISIIIFHNNQELSADQESSSDFANYVVNVPLPLSLYKKLYGGSNDSYIRSITYGVGVEKIFPNPKYNSLINILASILNIPLLHPF